MTPIIEARGLTKRFGDVDALDGLDLVAESGHVTALLGPNGAGQDHVHERGRNPAAARRRRDPRRRHRRLRRAQARARDHRSRRAVRVGRAGDDRHREPANGRPALRARVGARRALAAADGARATRISPTPATASCARTRVACAAGSTSAPAWSADRSCCCSTSPPPGSIPAAAWTCGSAIREPGRRRHRRAAHHPVPRGSRPARAPHRDHRPRPRHHGGNP